MGAAPNFHAKVLRQSFSSQHVRQTLTDGLQQQRLVVVVIILVLVVLVKTACIIFLFLFMRSPPRLKFGRVLPQAQYRRRNRLNGSGGMYLNHFAGGLVWILVVIVVAVEFQHHGRHPQGPSPAHFALMFGSLLVIGRWPQQAVQTGRTKLRRRILSIAMIILVRPRQTPSVQSRQSRPERRTIQSARRPFPHGGTILVQSCHEPRRVGSKADAHHGPRR
mmetsp:Transcript_29606/g.81380  ORF Transcript_29606/g.81380 Transcript_29606/m.81380 type:complete len:220 (+) Transcript_29606:313-972(+)